MTNIYDIKPTLKAFREAYGDRIDRISGVLSMMKKVVIGLSPEDAVSIFSNATYNFLDERYHKLMARREARMPEDEKRVCERRYAMLVKRLDSMVKEPIYGTPERQRVRKRIEAENMKRRIKSKKGNYYKPTVSLFSGLDTDNSLGVENLVVE